MKTIDNVIINLVKKWMSCSTKSKLLAPVMDLPKISLTFRVMYSCLPVFGSPPSRPELAPFLHSPAACLAEHMYALGLVFDSIRHVGAVLVWMHCPREVRHYVRDQMESAHRVAAALRY